MVKLLLKVIFAIITATYPFALYFGRQYYSPMQMSLVLFGVIFIRAYLLGFQTPAGRWWLAGGALLVLVTYIFNNDALLLWYPAIVNLIFLVFFARSLATPQTAIERLARLTEPNLPPHAVAYTRKVTILWCGFFIVNGALAIATTLYGDAQIWALYNGLIAYLLTAALFAAEWLYRQYHRRTHAHP
jgi:uncharacterized membrane protein